MGVDYEALIERRGVGDDEMARRKEAARLADIAENLATLHDLVIQQKRQADEAVSPAVRAPATAEK